MTILEEVKKYVSEEFDQRFGRLEEGKAPGDALSVGVEAGCDDCSMNQKEREEHKEFLLQQMEKAHREGQREERQFIFNVLDGIDIADKQAGNEGGGTKAIRFALASRHIG